MKTVQNRNIQVIRKLFKDVGSRLEDPKTICLSEILSFNVFLEIKKELKRSPIVPRIFFDENCSKSRFPNEISQITRPKDQTKTKLVVPYVKNTFLFYFGPAMRCQEGFRVRFVVLGGFGTPGALIS